MGPRSTMVAGLRRATALLLAVWTGIASLAIGPALAATEPERVRLFADHVMHDKAAGKAYATGRVRVVQSDVTVYAERIVYDEATDTSETEGDARIVHKEGQRETLITASKLVFNHQARHVTLEGPVKIDRPADPEHKPVERLARTEAERRQRLEAALKAARTVITADQGEYWTGPKIAKLTGNVIVLQREKKATAEKMTMDDPKGLLVLEDKAHVEQIKGNWLIAEGIVEEKPDDYDQKLAMRRTATLDAKRIDIFTKTNDMIATGNVVVEQKQQIAKSQKAVYRDSDQSLTLTEEVRFERPDKDWMTADRAIYDLEKERFEAFGEKGQVVSSIIVKTEPTPRPALPEMPADLELGPAPVVPTPASGPPPRPGSSPPPLPRPSAPPEPSPAAGSGSDAVGQAASDAEAAPEPAPTTVPASDVGSQAASDAVATPEAGHSPAAPTTPAPPSAPAASPSPRWTPRLPALPRPTPSVRPRTWT